MTIVEGRPTLVLIAGFSRAGKDTLANGLMEWSERRAAKVNFADPLKEFANAMLSYLHLEGDFFNEEFKVKHRDFLVSTGKFARSLNQDVFAEHLARYLDRHLSPLPFSAWLTPAAGRAAARGRRRAPAGSGPWAHHAGGSRCPGRRLPAPAPW